MRKNLLLLFTCIFLVFTAKADPQHIIPPIAVYGVIAGVTIGGLALALAISALLRVILQAILKEKRKHIWWMMLLTFLLPATFGVLDEEYHFLYEIDPYETMILVWKIIMFTLPVVGFLVGYFITPKKT